MKLQILGTGCPKCRQLLANAQQAVIEAGVPAEIEKVSEPAEIAKFRVLVTPALALDGVVVAAGRVPSPAEIKKLIEG